MTNFIRNNTIYNLQKEQTLSNIAQKRKSQGFDSILEQEIKKVDTLQFSKHSKERIEQRGISLTDEIMSDLNAAVVKAKLKGVKDVVMIGKEAAFIVSVPNNMVVTAMSNEEMQQNVFTNIDGAVIL